MIVKFAGIAKNAGFWFGLVLLGFSGVIFWEAKSMTYRSAFGPGPGFLPLWLSGFLAVLSVIFIWQSIQNHELSFSEILPRGKALGSVVLAPVSLLLFIVLVPRTGFTIAATAMLFILLVRGFRWYTSLAIALGISLLIMYVFKTLLNVPLPVNDWGW